MMKRLIRAAALGVALSHGFALADTFKDSGGTSIPGFAPLVGCSSGGNCGAPVSATNPLPTQANDATASGSISLTAANNAVTTGSLNGASSVGVSVSGTWTGTLSFQGSVDGTTWSSIIATPLGTSFAGATSTTANGLFQVPVAGMQAIRVTDLSTGTGTATVSLRASTGAAAIAPSTLGASSGSPAFVSVPTPLAVTRGESAWVSWSASATGAVAATVLDTSVYGYQQLEVEDTVASGTATITVQESNDPTWSSGVRTMSCSRISNGNVDNLFSSSWSSNSGYVCAISKRYVQVYLSACSACSVTGYANYKTGGVQPVQPAWSMAYAPPAGTGNGTTKLRIASASGTNATLVASGQHNLYSLQLCNAAASARYVRFFDMNTAPTVGSSTVAEGAIVLPAGQCVPSYHNIYGDSFANGIAFDITGGSGDSDTTSISAGDVQGWITYK